MTKRQRTLRRGGFVATVLGLLLYSQTIYYVVRDAEHCARLSWTIPDKRENGTDLPLNQIARYELYVFMEPDAEIIQLLHAQDQAVDWHVERATKKVEFEPDVDSYEMCDEFEIPIHWVMDLNIHVEFAMFTVDTDGAYSQQSVVALKDWMSIWGIVR